MVQAIIADHEENKQTFHRMPRSVPFILINILLERYASTSTTSESNSYFAL